MSTSRSTSTSTSSVRAAPWRPPTAGCSRPSRARPCWHCATSRSAPRRPRRSAAPTPPSCAARCCRPSATTCARRSPRSRPPQAACGTRTCGSPRPTAVSWPPRSRSRPTGSPAWSTTCSTRPGSPPALSRRSCSPSATTRSRSSPCAGSTARNASGSISPTTLPEVLADPGLLERVVANLVDNALRHGRGSPVTLRGSVLPGSGAGGRRSTSSSYGSSTRARAFPGAGSSACSPRSSGSATASRAGSASG